jgi:signal transduction histidine kinase
MRTWLQSILADRRNAVRGLQIGFGLVLTLLVVAGVLAVWEVQEMHERKATLAEQQKLMEHSAELALESVLLIGACLLIAAGGAMATISFVKKSLQQQEQQRDELNQVSWQMLQSQEQTARRFSHELHDELGQSLAALRANLSKSSTEDLDSLRADCMQLVDASIANVRELSQLLRPVILDDFGLDSALRWLVEGFAQRTRIDVQYQSDLQQRLAEETETHLFRIAQEALTNLARHADAQRVTVALRCVGRTVQLLIQDDGRGLAPAESSTGRDRPSIGMVSMRARARQCGGELTVSEALPHGVCVKAEVPLRLA